MGVSRATVVNYLSEARRRAFVRISLNTDIFRMHRLALRLKETFELSDVTVVPAGSDDTSSLDRVSRVAADWLPELLEPGDQLGVAWGETIYRVVEAAYRQPLDDLTVVQLVGSRPAALGFAAEICSATLAERLGALCINLHVPLLLSDADLAARLRREPVIEDQLRAVSRCNKVIFASGTVSDDSHIARTGLLTSEELAEARKRGASGVICARLIDRQGRPVETNIEERMIGVTLEQMQNKKMGFLVAAGPERVIPALSAIRGGYVTHMAICSDIATALLEEVE